MFSPVHAAARRADLNLIANWGAEPRERARRCRSILTANHHLVFVESSVTGRMDTQPSILTSQQEEGVKQNLSARERYYKHLTRLLIRGFLEWGESVDVDTDTIEDLLDGFEEDDASSDGHGEDEGEDVVRQRLREAVERVESVAGVRGGHNPLVVRLVQPLVADGMVLPAVNPVDAIVGEDEEPVRRKVSSRSRI